MDIDIYERLTKVETRLETISTDQAAMGTDVRAIRDYILTEKGAHRRSTKVWAGALALVTAGAAFWQAFGEQFKRFFG